MSQKTPIKQPATTIPAEEFLTAAYTQLGYDSGQGFKVPCDRPAEIHSEDAVEKYEWLKLAADLKAERLFFVNNYPVVLFFKLDAVNEEQLRQLHIQVWNMSRAPFFFVALPGELRLYSAYQKPVRDPKEWSSEQHWLKRVDDITQVAEALREFSRPEIESERAFRSLDRRQRADEWLLHNLRLLRQQLEHLGLSLDHTLDLIGRSIFIRYLEDRQVLLAEYFADVTHGRAKTYCDVLQNPADTYRLFRKLRDDFNGNMFPLSEAEERAATPKRLELLRSFLLGERMDAQRELFFWAYRFDVIPIELISSIYEEFYHELNDDKRGTHYTPAVLVDFVLSECLVGQQLESGTVLDLACGSGTFLVEAFRRMVYHQMNVRGRRLRPNELVKLLRERIFGVDINGAAIRVAAFSLYLALLDLMEPSDIRRHQLPLLLYTPGKKGEDNGANLFEANSFWLTPAERLALTNRLRQRSYAGRARDKQMLSWPQLLLGDSKFDLVVGNPPWGEPEDSEEGKRPSLWCEAFDLPVGDKELSQCFVWRARSLLTPSGEASLLVSSGVFFKHNQTSLAFRQTFLRTNRIRAVFDFSHVRHTFFQGQKNSADAPFAALFFSKAEPEKALHNKLIYASAKRTQIVERLQVVTLDRSDWHIVSQAQILEFDALWKVLLWGGIQDIQLIAELGTNKALRDFVSDYGRGFEETGRQIYHSDQLGVKLELPIKFFARQIDSEHLVPIVPRGLYRLGNLALYKGPRLLIKGGLTERGDRLAEITATLDNRPFAFRSSICGMRLDSLPIEHRKVLLGIVWSSLTLYYHFLTCAKWGFWHHDILIDEHLGLPVRLPEDKILLQHIVNLVDRLAKTNSNTPTLFAPTAVPRATLEKELDEAVFDLYELSEEQRDLVRDFCQTTLDFFYNGSSSNAVKRPALQQLQEYKTAFLDVWQDRLKPKDKELEARIYAPASNPLVGISFDLKRLGTAKEVEPLTDDVEWNKLFRRLAKALPEQRSQRIYLDRVVKALAGSSMLIVKRAEQRLWTRSQARRDANELLTEVFKVEWQRG
jgi:SAM-dependent methyltransferase